MNGHKVVTYVTLKDYNRSYYKRTNYNSSYKNKKFNEGNSVIYINRYKYSKMFNQSGKKSNSPDKLSTSSSDDSELSVNVFIDDIEDLLTDTYGDQNDVNIKMLSPIIRYSKKWSLSITELSSQLWCERSLELTLITGIRPDTEAMRQGTQRHEQLEQLDHEIIEVTVTCNEEDLGVKMLNSIILIENLLETRKCREIWIFGSYNDYIFKGIVDQLEIIEVDGKNLLKISDTKTRRSKNEPSQAQKLLSYTQVQAYHLLITNLKNKNVDFNKLYKYSELDPERQFVISELKQYKCLRNLEKFFLRAFEKLPNLCDFMEISYECEGEIFLLDKIQVDLNNLVKTIDHCLDFWDGNRSSEIVQPFESWKCKFCHLLDQCVESPYKKYGLISSQSPPSQPTPPSQPSQSPQPSQL